MTNRSLRAACSVAALLVLASRPALGATCANLPNCTELMTARGDFEVIVDPLDGATVLLVTNNGSTCGSSTWPTVANDDIEIHPLGTSGDSPSAPEVWTNAYAGCHDINGPEFIPPLDPASSTALGIWYRGANGPEARFRGDTVTPWDNFGSPASASPGTAYPADAISYAGSIGYTALIGNPLTSGCSGMCQASISATNGQSGVLTTSNGLALVDGSSNANFYARTLHPAQAGWLAFTGLRSGTPGLFFVDMTFNYGPLSQSFGTPARMFSGVFTDPNPERETLNAAVFPGTGDTIWFAIDDVDNVWVWAEEPGAGTYDPANSTFTNVVDTETSGASDFLTPARLGTQEGIEHVSVATDPEGVTMYYQIRDTAPPASDRGSYRLRVINTGTLQSPVYQLSGSSPSWIEHFSDCANATELLYVPSASGYLSYELSEDAYAVQKFYACVP